MEEFNTVTDTQNPLFNRREIEGEVHAEVTPSRAEVAQILSKKFSADIDAIKIRTIKGRFGSKTFVVVANIYASKQDKDKTEAKSKRDAKQDIKAETPAEEVSKTEEQPKQEVKEESPKEENKSEEKTE